SRADCDGRAGLPGAAVGASNRSCGSRGREESGAVAPGEGGRGGRPNRTVRRARVSAPRDVRGRSAGVTSSLRRRRRAMRVRGRVRRACRPGLERVEARELLSGLMVALGANRPNVTAADLLATQLSGIHADQGGGGGGNGAGGSGSSGLI